MAESLSLQPDALRVNLDGLDGLSITTTFAYHMGLRESIELTDPAEIERFRQFLLPGTSLLPCPRPYVDCAGLHFPVTQRLLERVPGTDNQRQQGNEVYGALHCNVTPLNLKHLAERLPRLLIQFTPGSMPPVQTHSGGEGYDPTGAPKGRIVSLPSEEHVQALAKRGREARVPPRTPFDISAAAFMYMVPCEDQEKPQRTHGAPPTILEAGIQWPGDEQKRGPGRPKGSKNRPRDETAHVS